jgi:hypothetical protein
MHNTFRAKVKIGLVSENYPQGQAQRHTIQDSLQNGHDDL